MNITDQENPIDLIRERFSTLPNEIKAVIKSTNLNEKIKFIGKKNGLFIDQVGLLENEVLYILLGLEPSEDFVDNISRELNIDKPKSITIGKDVNKEVFDAIKEQLRSIESVEEQQQNASQATTSSLERMGGISIEKPAPESESTKVTAADRGNILAGLENPPSGTAHTSQPPQNLPVVEEETGPFSETSAAKSTKKEGSHTEPLVDLLLSKPAGQSVQNVIATPPPALKPKTPVSPPKSSGGPDPYREAIK